MSIVIFIKFKNIITESPYSIEYYDSDNPYPTTIYTTSDAPVSSEGFDFYRLRTADGEPYNTVKININHMIQHYEKITKRYAGLNNILNIKNILLNKKTYQYEYVNVITSYITTLMSDYASNTTNPSTANSILTTTKSYIDQNYKNAMDVIKGTFTSLIEKSINDIINIGMSTVNPYTYTQSFTSSFDTNVLSNLNNWWESNRTSTSFLGSPNAGDLLTSITDNIDSVKLFAEKNINIMYNNYSTRLDILNYVICSLVSLTDFKIFVDLLPNSISLYDYKNSLKTYLDTQIQNDDAIIKEISVVGDTVINNGYSYPLYSFNNPNTTDDNKERNFNITYPNSNLDTMILRFIANENPQYAWVRELANKIIKKVTFECDGIVYDEYNSDLLHMNHVITANKNHEYGYRMTVGDDDDTHAISNYKRPTETFYVELPFWFGRDIGNALPLINTIHSDMYIIIETSDLDEILYKEIGCSFRHKFKIKTNLISEYIYIDDDERMKIAQSKLEYLIETHQHSGTIVYEAKDFKNNTLHTKLYFSDPCKYLLWTTKVRSRIPNEVDKIDWTYNGYRLRDDDGRLTIVKPTSDKIKIQFDGIDREGIKDKGFYSTLQPFNRGVSSLNDGEFMYIYSLFPLLLQPSGHASLSYIHDFTVVDQFNEKTVKDIEDNNLIVIKDYWVKTYKIIRIMSGIMAPAFINI